MKVQAQLRLALEICKNLAIDIAASDDCISIETIPLDDSTIARIVELGWTHNKANKTLNLKV